jgi:hypothetical protein
MEPMTPMEPMKPMAPMKPLQPLQDTTDWLPAGLGSPSASGAQNGMRYAFFPQQRRLAIQQQEGGDVVQYDTGDHAISGVSQQSSSSSPLFSSQHGDVDLKALKQVG